MKKLLFLVTLFSICSCVEKKNSQEYQNTLAELKVYEDSNATEGSTKQFVEDYFKNLNSSDWKSKALKYLQPNPEKFLEEHAAFRASFQNYKATVKHLTVDGNEGIVWIHITANYASNFTFENSAYGDEIYIGIEANNQELSWDETWYFDVVDGKFGDKWDALKDNYKILEDLNVDM